jgi:hypothetical protein
LQTLVTYILLAVLAGSVVVFLVAAVLQHRRTGFLSSRATERGMRFSAADSFEVPRRYRLFTAISGGHSARASNMTYGRVDGWPVRAFDFRYEVGHGTHRETRHYGVLAVETDLPLPEALLWNEADAAEAPLPAVLGDGTVACWSYRGDDHLARVLGDAAVPLAGQRVSIESQGGVVLLAKPLPGAEDPYGDLLDRAEAVVEAVREAFGPREPAAAPQA